MTLVYGCGCRCKKEVLGLVENVRTICSLMDSSQDHMNLVRKFMRIGPNIRISRMQSNRVTKGITRAYRAGLVEP